jgi:hypothetical protein
MMLVSKQWPAESTTFGAMSVPVHDSLTCMPVCENKMPTAGSPESTVPPLIACCVFSSGSGNDDCAPQAPTERHTNPAAATRALRTITMTSV